MNESLNLLHAVCERGQMVDVHEGNLGAHVVSEFVEGGFIGDVIVGSGDFLQDGDGFAGCRACQYQIGRAHV